MSAEQIICLGQLTDARTVLLLEKEKKLDLKLYIQKNPNSNQKHVSEVVKNFFENGVLFDKDSYCETYAEYFLYSAAIVIQQLKGIKCKNAKEEMRKSNALVAYYRLFLNNIENGEHYFFILKKYYNNVK